MAVGELEVFTADASGEISTAHYSLYDSSSFILAFYNRYKNENGVIITSFGFKTLDYQTALEFLQFVDNIYLQYTDPASSNSLLLFAIWFLCMLFLAFFGGFLDLVGYLFLIGFIIYGFLLWLIAIVRKRKRL